GEWISAQWYAWIIRWGLGVGGFLLATLLPWLFASLGTHLSRPRASVIAALLFGVATLVSVGDRLAKPGLFPKFHVAVFFGVGALLYLGVRLIVTQVAAARLRRPAVSATASALLAVAASIWILMNPGTRSSLLLASPVAANLLREVWPTPSVQLLGGDVLAQDHTSQHHATLRAPEGANVLLITVDAMRADTVPPGRPPKSRYKKKTPFLDRWLERTFRFTYAYAQSTKTLGSLPPMFSSQEAHVDTTRAGIPLAEAAREMGFTPVAVVPTNFLEPRSHGLNRRLVIGYDHLRVYAHEQMNEIDTLVAEVFDSAGPRPVFMWLHLYQLHEPGFDERLLTRKDGSWKARYPRSLAALDREFEEIIGSLDSRGLTENTIIVFASDHGENLGEHGARTHGTDLFDATTRVPLAFHIPGMAGALIDRTVGNIDVLPTIRDLLGLSPDPTHSGRSLVPLMAQPALPWKRAYYLHLRSHKIAGLVYGRQKLLYDWGGGVFHRFDLEQDPGEQRDIYDESGALDGDLRQTLAWHNPSLARDELSAEDNRTELRVSL
ncbi:MAG: sulfatase, partial [Nannocystaceae bacterium]